jgi:hypothetical protein
MGQKSYLYLLSFTCQLTLHLPFAVCLARIRAHGCDPLVPTATGVYDGPQEAPRYFIVGVEYQGLNLLCVNWVGMRCAEKAVNGLDQ